MSFNFLGFYIQSKEEENQQYIYETKLNETITNQQLEIDQLKQKLANTNLDFPKSYGTITWQEELNLLKNICPTVFITDDFLNVTTVDEARVFGAETKVQFRRWITNNYDCDNFDAALYGYWNEGTISYAIGYARSDNHAFNVMIDNNKQIWIIEPQTNEFLTIDQAKQRTTNGAHYFPISLILM